MNYHLKLESMTLKVYDNENQQHKIFEVRKPISGETVEQIWDTVESRLAILPWLPNRIMRKLNVEAL